MRRAPARPRGEQRERLPRAGAGAARLPQDGAPHRGRVPHGGARPQVLRRPLLLLPAAALRRLRHAARAGLLHVLHGGDGRDEPFGPRAHRQRLHLPARQAPRGVALRLLHGAARGVAAPALQPAGAAAGGAAAGDGARVAAHRRRLHGRRAGRLSGHVGVRHGRVPGGGVRRRVCSVGCPSRQRPPQLQQYGVRHRAPHRDLFCSECRRGFRSIRPLRSGRDPALSAGVVRRSPDGGAGRAHHRPARAQELRAEAPRTAHVVGGAGRVRSLHPLRRPLQCVQPGVRVSTRASVRSTFRATRTGAGVDPRPSVADPHSGKGPASLRHRAPVIRRPVQRTGAKTEDDVRPTTAQHAGGRNNSDSNGACRRKRTSMLVKRKERAAKPASAVAAGTRARRAKSYYSGCSNRTSVSSIF